MNMAKVKFNDIAGYAEEKRELKEISNLISHWEELKEAGGEIPKGLLLAGASGVGKTLFANVLINETNCKCVRVNHTEVKQADSLQEYIESKFKEAASSVPCILYIDDFTKLNSNINYFEEDDINKDGASVVLSQLNKYNDIEGLFVLICSDRPNSNNNNILRNGHIDKTIYLARPSENERLEIIKYYCKNKQLGDDVDVNKISKLLNGFTAADIKTILNNSVAKAFCNGRKVVQYNDINEAYYDNMLVVSSKDLNMSEERLNLTAHHEAGHAVVAMLNCPDTVHYATIKPRGNALGFVNMCPEEEVPSTCFDEKFNSVCIAVAGRVAEETFLNKTSEGCRSDLEYAVSAISQMVRIDGMMGIEYIDTKALNPRALGFCSTQKSNHIEEKEDELLTRAFNDANMLLHSNEELFNEVVSLLKEKQNLLKPDIDALISKYHLKEIDINRYKLIKQRVGMFNYVTALIIMREFNVGYYQADLIIDKLIKDKLIGPNPSRKGYRVRVC